VLCLDDKEGARLQIAYSTWTRERVLIRRQVARLETGEAKITVLRRTCPR